MANANIVSGEYPVPEWLACVRTLGEASPRQNRASLPEAFPNLACDEAIMGVALSERET
jgi:hypothetical protein